MRTISVRSLQRETSSVLQSVVHGESILVTNRNRIMARILPPEISSLSPKKSDFKKRFSEPPLLTKSGKKTSSEILRYMRGEIDE